VRSQKKEERNSTRITHHASRITVSIIPGVPAFCAAASLIGAPLMHDFASISLSDLLTPWQTIKKRLKMASEGDFVIILYNPKSKTRVSQIEGAIEIISMHRDGNTPVGIVKNALRDGEEIKITTLRELPGCYDFIDMSTILIIGNSATFISNNRMITPRGYDV
ncbi:MAG: precorrin-3B C(17)-methyltransferase, partial [Deltaproteobacteria bacterium]